jgi:hypothetical protein
MLAALMAALKAALSVVQMAGWKVALMVALKAALSVVQMAGL